MPVLYDILGIDQEATPESIEQAFLRIQSKHDLDKTMHLPASEHRKRAATLGEAVSAHGVLSDQYLRLTYDSFQRPTRRDRGPPIPTPTLRVHWKDWKFDIAISSRFRTIDLGEERFSVEGDRIIIGFKVEEKAEPSGEKDVTVYVDESPGCHRVTEIRSMYKRTKTPSGLELTLKITLIAPSDAPKMLTWWDFGWDVDPIKASFPPDSPCYATYLTFHYAEPEQLACMWTIPPHKDNPAHHLQNDSDLQPFDCVHIQGDVYKKIEYGEDNVMHRLAGLGYRKPQLPQDGSWLSHMLGRIKTCSLFISALEPA